MPKERLGYGVFKAPTDVGSLQQNQPAVAPSVLQTALTDIRTNPKQQLGPTGIKFPFRFSSSGRVAVSTTNINDTSHIKESIEQILFTRFRERFFLPLFGSPLADLVFEPQEQYQTVLEAELLSALETWEPRITVTAVNVSVDHYTNTAKVSLEYEINIVAPQISISQLISVAL